MKTAIIDDKVKNLKIFSGLNFKKRKIVGVRLYKMGQR